MDIEEEDLTVSGHRTSETSKRAKEKLVQEDDDKKRKVNGLKSEAEDKSKDIKKEIEDVDMDKVADKNAEVNGSDSEDDNVSLLVIYCNWF